MVLMSNVIRFLDRLLDMLVLLLCALILAVSVYSLIDNTLIYRRANDASLLKYRPRLDVPLSESMPESEQADTRAIENQVAWICFEDTGIDFPVVQGEDNFVYLNRDAFGDFSLSGAIFLDSRSAPDFTDPYSLIYGHHLEHGKMFGCLENYTDRAFFDAHRIGTLVTEDEVLRIELCAVIYADGTDSVLFRPEGQTTEGVLAYAEKHADIFLPPGNAQRILALSTCYGDSFTSRLLVLGILTTA